MKIGKSRVLIYADGADILGSSAIAYVLERIGLAQSVNILDGGSNGLPRYPGNG